MHPVLVIMIIPSLLMDTVHITVIIPISLAVTTVAGVVHTLLQVMEAPLADAAEAMTVGMTMDIKRITNGTMMDTTMMISGVMMDMNGVTMDMNGVTMDTLRMISGT